MLEGYGVCLKTAVLSLVLLAALGQLFAQPLVGLFRDDPAVTAIGTPALRFQ